MVTRTRARFRWVSTRAVRAAALLGAVSMLATASASAQVARPPQSRIATPAGAPQAPLPLGATIRSGQTRRADDRGIASRPGTRSTNARGPVQCEKCHADRQFLHGKAKIARGDSLLFVPDTLLRDSRHRTLVCADCHAGYNDGYPHVKAPAVSLECEHCHESQGAAYHRSIHAKNFADTTKGDAPTCVNCHSSHEVLGSDDPRSPTYPLNVARLCASCHAKREIVKKYFDESKDTTAQTAVADFRRSVHGLALSKAGLTVSASCSDCHDAHRVLPHDSTESTVNRLNLKATCGACHAGVLTAFDSSAHGKALASGDTTESGKKAPICIECHGGHNVKNANDARWFGGVVQECGACHQRLIETYAETYHGKATALGYGIAAKCSDCHTAHSMLKAKDTLSSVNPKNLVETCGTCHSGANARFVMYKPHGDHHDRERNPELYWVWLAMTSLLVGVFSFFGLHSLLWFARLLSARNERGAHAHVASVSAGETVGVGGEGGSSAVAQTAVKEAGEDVAKPSAPAPSAPTPSAPASTPTADAPSTTAPKPPPPKPTTPKPAEPNPPTPTPKPNDSPSADPTPDKPGDTDTRGPKS